MDKYISSFVETIKEYIEVNHSTPTAFAREIGCRDFCVMRWLNGTNVPSLEYVIMVADFLKCSVDFLLGVTDQNVYTPSSKRYTFAERFSSLQKSSKKSLNQLAKACGSTSSTLSKWILRGQLPKPQTVCLLAEQLGCSVDFLLGRVDS